jgi:hypothetical protein
MQRQLMGEMTATNLIMARKPAISYQAMTTERDAMKLQLVRSRMAGLKDMNYVHLGKFL